MFNNFKIVMSLSVLSVMLGDQGVREVGKKDGGQARLEMKEVISTDSYQEIK